MAISNTELITSGLTTIFTSSGPTAITTIIACNTGTPNITDETVNASTLSLFLVPTGKAAGNGTAIVNNLTVPAGETVFFSDEKIIIESGDTIVARAGTANLLTLTVSSMLI